MGSVLGEKVTLLVEEATTQKLPLILVCMSGGARMHEGALSLMQMAKTSAALGRFDAAGGLYIAILADPTTGGTTASFAMLGDLIIAEPGALIGFAGQRVIANTIKAELPEGFQRAEFLLEHGFIDMIVPRKDLRSELAKLIDYCGE
jgi:acetyl-CoA carboxylase carboxyl transferase subunit beta